MANRSTFSSEVQAQRLDLALHATYEADAVARHLNVHLPMEQPEYQYLRALVVRLLDLNSVVMSVLGDDDGRATIELQGVLDGDRRGAGSMQIFRASPQG